MTTDELVHRALTTGDPPLHVVREYLDRVEQHGGVEWVPTDVAVDDSRQPEGEQKDE